MLRMILFAIGYLCIQYFKLDQMTFGPFGKQIQIEYRYYDLALQKCNRSSSYTIHGLWPEYNTTNWPAYCYPNKKFDPQKLEPIVNQMQQVWPSCLPSDSANSTDYDFWAHEWYKHGTCTSLDQLDYFNRTLNLYQYVQSHGVVPQRCNQCSTTGGQCLIRFNLNWTLASTEQ